MRIRLERSVWSFDERVRLGPPGGFGEVFRGEGEGGAVAIKRLNVTASAAAHRELTIGRALSSKELKHVVPVLDYGQDADSDRYFLVMPICEGSLQDKLLHNGTLPWEQAKQVILDVIAGLQEVGEVVHRDLKPGNILFHEEVWKIADFGIAKFVEDSTSLETLRQALTPAFAAPEQWNGEAPTHATDVYALGCIIHTMLSGSPPFIGDVEAIRRGHMLTPAPELKGVDPRVTGLVHNMLRKAPESRPSIQRCATVLASANATPPRSASKALAEAGSAIAQKIAAEEAKARAVEVARRQRSQMAIEAILELHLILGRLFKAIADESEMVDLAARSVALGPAQMMYEEPLEVPQNGDVDRYDKGWNVVAATRLGLQSETAGYSPHRQLRYIFTVNLVFAITPSDRDYRWREMSFWSLGRDMNEQPFALEPGTREFALGVSTTIASGLALAHGPVAIDGEDEEAFQDRWITLFAKAVEGRLHPPSNLPLQPQFFK